MPATRLSTFDDWVDLFRVWQKDIGVDYPEITNYQFEAKFGPTRSNEVEFGRIRADRSGNGSCRFRTSGCETLC